MDSTTVQNQAVFEVTHNLGPSNTNNMSAALREKYENERAHQEKLKQEKKG